MSRAETKGDAVTHIPIQPPILSLAERSRRWALVRSLMRERGFDGLLVAGFRSREMYETYITDDYNEGCVIFPLEGNPIVITWAHLRVMRARWSQERGTKLWVDDYHVATSGTAVAEVLREKRLDESSLGVVGLSSQAPTEIYGAIPANFWMELTAAVPKARWEDISEEFSHLMLVKSDEELAQVRYAARAAEAACRVVVELTDVAPRHRATLPHDCHEFGPAHSIVGATALDDERRGTAHSRTRRFAADGADAPMRQSGGSGADDRGS
jgi:Xaa-Pro aminopeptidase